jgi:hypothetical protein
VDARRAAAEVHVNTANVDGFTLKAGTPTTRVIIDGSAIRIPPARASSELSFTHAAAGWRAGLAPVTAKRPGAEGPIAAAVSSRHIYVFGTLGTQAPEEVEARRRVADEAAAWSTTRSHLSLQLTVKADNEVTQADLDSGSLVLFGTAQTNSVIARFQNRLPLALAPGAADYGLLFIFPIGTHYVLVNSGLPWWTGAGDAAGAGYPLAPLQYRLLASFGDYILFRGSVTHVIMEGRFDRDWKLPAAAAAKMSAGGIVTVN